jgi:hypothetical protein
MASWTDAISQFNPYVSTLPVEAMVKVGMEKQKRYDDGVQKIQSQIDQVAGLDVLKDVDKNYLQSKLNQLGSDLRTFAASDFSNYQLVNSVSGMTKQVSNDQTVQNAVSATSHYRSEVKRIDEARKKGKSDKNNEDFFYNGANKWLNDNTAGTKFSDSFVEYTDVMKTIRENVSAAGIDSKYIEQVFETDDKGRILRDKNNHPIPARVMATETLDTNASKVKDIVANVLSQGNVKQQLNIDGWANTRNVSVESVYKTFVDDFAVRESDSGQNILLLQTLIDSDNITTEERDALIKQQNGIKEIQESDRKKIIALSKRATEDPEQFKIDYYQDGYVNNLINGFTINKSKKEVKDSPLRQQLNWEERMDFDRNKESFDRKIALATAARADRTLQLQELQFNADYEFDPATGRYKKVPTESATKKKNEVNTTTTSEINSENKGSEIDAIASYKGITSQIQDQAQLKGLDLIYTYLYKVNNGKNKDGTPFTRNDVLNNVNSFAKSTGESPYQFIMRFSGDLKNKSELNGIKLSVQDLEKLDEVNKLHNDAVTRLAVTEDLYRQVKKETGIDPKEFQLQDIQPQPANAGDRWVKRNLGIDIKQDPVITVEDQSDYMTWYSAGALKGSPEAKIANDKLAAKYGSVLNFENLLDKRPYAGVKTKLQQFSGNKNFANYNKSISEKFKKVNVVSDNFSSTLSGTDDELKLAKANVLSLFNSQRLKESEQEDIASILTSPGGGVTYDARRPTKEGELWTGTIFVTNKEGKKYSVDVDQANLETITGRKFNPYVEDGLRARANISEFGSTNLGAYTTDPNAYTTAAIKSGRFASLKDSDYTAFADIMPLSGGKLGIAIYAKDKTMSKFERIEMVPVKQVVNGVPVYFSDYNEISGVVPNITPAMIKNALAKLKQK